MTNNHQPTEPSETVGLEDWPSSLRSIAKSIGVDGALLLSERIGGLEYYIPHHSTDNHPLALLLGPERFRLLRQSHGGKRLAIPRDVNAHLSKGKILSLLEQGWHPRKIARECGVTQRYVRRVSELMPKRSDPRQTSFAFVIE